MVRYEPGLFGSVFWVLGLCLLLWWAFALFGCVVFGYLARISVVTTFNSIKVTCALRHTQRLQPCKKKVFECVKRHAMPLVATYFARSD